MKGTDQAFSLSPSGMTRLCKELRRAHVAMGDGGRALKVPTNGMLPGQLPGLVGRRLAVDLRADDYLVEHHLTD